MIVAPLLLPVTFPQLRGVWSVIRDRIDRIAIDLKQPWVSEDVFHEILSGNAHLWALADNSGFVVIRLFATAYERTLHVWICSNHSGPKIVDYLDQIKGIAAANDCERVTFESPRRYQRALPGVKATYSYSIEVGD
jgi:hypothetical protein